MTVKTDTKEKFHAITVAEPLLSAVMTAELSECLLSYLQNGVNVPGDNPRNVVLIMKEVDAVELPVAETLVRVQQQFYEQSASFVICALKPAVEDFLEKHEILELLNVTPSESEAWDIVQMEEIERELMDGDEE